MEALAEVGRHSLGYVLSRPNSCGYDTKGSIACILGNVNVFFRGKINRGMERGFGGFFKGMERGFSRI
ncbi:MAG: hypothetical protein FWG87_08400 [Defluviitaleaceae bacterium]|nr:hypothetical protein [Defluviitaleaceae bacterium]